MACRNLFCGDWWRGLRPHHTLKLKPCQRLIVGWNLEYCQRIKFSSTSKSIRDGGPHRENLPKHVAHGSVGNRWDEMQGLRKRSPSESKQHTCTTSRPLQRASVVAGRERLIQWPFCPAQITSFTTDPDVPGPHVAGLPKRESVPHKESTTPGSRKSRRKPNYPFAQRATAAFAPRPP